MSKFRHVCLEDLKDYFKKSDYFGDLTREEKNEIKQNLNINDSYIVDSFDNIKFIAEQKELIPGSFYIINNYQYLDDNYSSNTYQIVTRALNNESFSPNVIILKDNKPLDWEVKYDIFQGARGTITYLKDENGNSAFYDFKNKKYLIDNNYLFTFSKFVNNGYIECSDRVYNVTIDKLSNDNVFIVNNKLQDVHLKDCHNNIIKQDLINCNMSISNKVLENIPYLSEDLQVNIQKLNTDYVIEYLDRDTLTLQYQLI